MLPPDLDFLLIDGVISQNDGAESSSLIRTRVKVMKCFLLVTDKEAK